MQNQFGAIDCHKLTWLLQEGVEKLHFLSHISKEDDTSSELAGYEINKLLTRQAQLESQYDDLIQIRAQLKGISNKKALDAKQKEIQEVAHQLKESTKKLGRLFRDDFDLASDAKEIAEERDMLKLRLENVLTYLHAASFVNFQNELINDLDDQDSLRKLIIQEKQLIGDIKSLHIQWKNENQEYQNEINEKQANIQKHKEKLVKSRTKAEIETKYKDRQIKAGEGTHNRIHEQKLAQLQADIDEFERKKNVEIEVFDKVMRFLQEKEMETRQNFEQWQAKFEEKKEEKEKQIEKLTLHRETLDKDIEDLRLEIETYELEKNEKERKEIDADEEKRRKREEEERLDEAVKKIQDYYKAWKDGGGTMKKKKKKKKKK